MNPTGPEDAHLDVESFGRQHPAMNPQLLLEHARVALSKHGVSPREVTVTFDRAIRRGTVAFRMPEVTSANTLQEKTFTELGAVVMAGLLLHRQRGLQLTRATRCGSRVDYFVGRSPGSQEGVVEVKGRDVESVESLAERARSQLSRSFYMHAGYNLPGYVAVTRFAPMAASLVRLELPHTEG